MAQNGPSNRVIPILLAKVVLLVVVVVVVLLVVVVLVFSLGNMKEGCTTRMSPRTGRSE